MQKTLSTSEQAILDWKTHPALEGVFEGVDQYADYLRCSFESLVEQHMNEKKCSKSSAIRTVAGELPDIHRKWIKVENIFQRSRSNARR